MSQSIYADGISNITLVDGVIRYDLVNITSLEEKSANVRSVATVAMSLPALVRTYEQLSGVISKMVEQGLLNKAESSEPVAHNIQVNPDSASKKK